MCENIGSVLAAPGSSLSMELRGFRSMELRSFQSIAVSFTRRRVDINLMWSENSPMLQHFSDPTKEMYITDWLPVSPALPDAKIVSQTVMCYDIRCSPSDLTLRCEINTEVNNDGSAIRATIRRWGGSVPMGLVIRVALDNLESIVPTMVGNVTSLGETFNTFVTVTSTHLDTLEAESQQQLQEIALLASDIKQHQKQNTAMAASNQQLKEQFEHLTNVNQDLSVQMQAVTSESRQLKGELANLVSESRQFSSALTGVETSLADRLNAGLELVSADIVQLASSVAEDQQHKQQFALMTNQNQQQQKQIAEVTEQVEQLTSMNQRLSDQMQVVTAESQQLKQEVANLAFAMQQAVQPVPSPLQADTAAAEWLCANKFTSVADALEWVKGSCYSRIGPALVPLGVSSADDMLLLQPDMVAELSSIPPVFRKKLAAVLTHAVTAKDQVEVVFGRHLQWMSKSLGATNADEVISLVTREDLLSVLPASSLSELEQKALIAAVNELAHNSPQ